MAYKTLLGTYKVYIYIGLNGTRKDIYLSPPLMKISLRLANSLNVSI